MNLDYRVGFFGNFSQAFKSIVCIYDVQFVISELNKENLEIKQYCEQNNIQYFLISSIVDIKKTLDSFSNIDLFIVASFGLIFDEELINFPKYNVINFHPGILPRYRGRHPLPQAIVNKDKYMGITAHIMNIEIDKGGILGIEKIPINYELSYKENENILLSFIPKVVNQALKNYFNKEFISSNGEENYYKPLEKEVLVKICSTKKLKELSFENCN